MSNKDEKKKRKKFSILEPLKSVKKLLTNKDKKRMKDSKDSNLKDEHNSERSDDIIVNNEFEITLNLSKDINENINKINNDEINDTNINKQEKKIDRLKEDIIESTEEDQMKENDLFESILDIKKDIKDVNKFNRKNHNEISGLMDELCDLKKILVEDKNDQIKELKQQLNKKENDEIKLLKKFLNIVDEFDNIYEFSVKAENELLLNSVNDVLKVIRKNLMELGIEEIPALGEKFSEEVHYCIEGIVDETKSKNEIIKVIKKGYKKDGKLVRSAKVIAIK